MTDKTIIHGVDMSGCEFFFRDNINGIFTQELCACMEEHTGTDSYKTQCLDNPDCYYKQSARKDERIRELELLNSQMTCKLEKLAHENGELKQKLKQIAQLTQKLRTKTDYHGEDEVNADLDQILEIINSRGNDER